jgi:hypothetical protein
VGLVLDRHHASFETHPSGAQDDVVSECHFILIIIAKLPNGNETMFSRVSTSDVIPAKARIQGRATSRLAPATSDR